jgi:hypothetical protein
MTILLILTLNPITQIKKGQDAQRQQDLKQINNALDTFYNDTNCYPTALSQLSGSTVYMKTVPSDPASRNGWQDYAYVTDNSSCPQWNVIFAKVNYTPNASTACPLKQMGTCFPTDANNPGGYNYCVLSGSVDCPTIAAIVLPAGGNPGVTTTNTPIPSSTSTPTPTPTTPQLPTPTPCPCSQSQWNQDGNFCDLVNPGTGLYCGHSGNQCLNRCQ